MASTVLPFMRSTANRAVHLRITPRPSNIGESREIMRLISQFGEIEYFKNLKYDTLSAPNAAIVIFQQEDAAQHCLKKSPIRFRMGRAPAKQPQQQEQQQHSLEQHHRQAASSPSPTASTQGNPWGVSNPSHTQTRALSTRSSLPKPPPGPYDLPGSPNLQQPNPEPESRIFQIQANTARVSFRDQLDGSHFHGHFHINTKSAAQQDLAKRVPIPGLSDVNWRAEDKPWRMVQMEKERDGSFRGSGPRKSLMEVYEEGMRKG